MSILSMAPRALRSLLAVYIRVAWRPRNDDARNPINVAACRQIALLITQWVTCGGTTSPILDVLRRTSLVHIVTCDPVLRRLPKSLGVKIAGWFAFDFANHAYECVVRRFLRGTRDWARFTSPADLEESVHGVLVVAAQGHGA